MPRCVLERDWAPGTRESPGAGLPPPPEPAPRPRPRPAPAALSVSISVNRLQTERARRWVNAIGALPGAQATLPARPPPRAAEPASPRPPAAPRLQRSSRSTRAPRGGAQPQPAPHSGRRRGGSRTGRAPGTHDPVAAQHVSVPCAGDLARCAGEARAESRGAPVPVSLKCRSVRVREGSWGSGRWRRPELGGVDSKLHPAGSPPWETEAQRVQTPPFGGERECANERSSAGSQARCTGRQGRSPPLSSVSVRLATTSVSKFFQQTRAFPGAPRPLSAL